MDEKNVKAEYRRLISILKKAEVPQQIIEALKPLLDNLAWQRIKLDETRDAIRSSSVAIPYDNGGNQKGIRENPLFKGYESLWKAYMAGLEKFTSYLPKDVAEETTSATISMIEQVKAMKKAKA